MSKHPHAELLKQWAEDTSLVIEYFDAGDCWKQCYGIPGWNSSTEYRIKQAEPKKVKIKTWYSNRGCIAEVFEGSIQDQQYAEYEGKVWHHIPELDKEVTLP